MKKILALFLAAILMFALIGCGCEDEVANDKDEREEQGTDKEINTIEKLELKENQILIEEQTEKDDENPKVIRRTYDWKGNLLSYSYDVKDMEGVWYEEECVYDEEDNLIKKVQSFSSGERIETVYTYEYGKMVFIEKCSVHDEDDIKYAECIYDGDNRIEQWHDSDGKAGHANIFMMAIIA